MRPNVTRLIVDRVIVHDVPKKVFGALPRLSEVESELTPELKLFFQERIQESLQTRAFDVVFDEETESPAPGLVSDHLTGDGDDFVEMSRQLALHLDACQNRSNSSGLLTIVRGTTDEIPCLAVLKLERLTGVRLDETDRGGLPTFDLSEVRNLMMATNVRVFKACAFVFDAASEAFSGLLSDNQHGSARYREVARFFISGFLGCRLRTAPEVTTSDFFSFGQEFINSHAENQEQLAKYHMALVTELASASTIVEPMRFAERHLEGGHREAFLQSLDERGISTTEIEKDNTLIAQHLRYTRWNYESGIAVTGPQDKLDSVVTFGHDENDMPTTTIHDRLKEAHARKR